MRSVRKDRADPIDPALPLLLLLVSESKKERECEREGQLRLGTATQPTNANVRRVTLSEKVTHTHTYRTTTALCSSIPFVLGSSSWPKRACSSVCVCRVSCCGQCIQHQRGPHFTLLSQHTTTQHLLVHHQPSLTHPTQTSLRTIRSAVRFDAPSLLSLLLHFLRRSVQHRKGLLCLDAECRRQFGLLWLPREPNIALVPAHLPNLSSFSPTVITNVHTLVANSMLP